MATKAAETFVTFDVPGSSGTTPTAINSVGTITGMYSDANFVAHSFVRAPNGALTPFDPPGAVGGSAAVAIDDEGTITGQACDAVTCHGFLRYSGGGICDIRPSRGAIYISHGAVAGFYCDATACHGFLRSRIGAFTTFDPPGPIFTGEFAGLGVGNVIGLNEAGTITGAFLDPLSNVQHGFVRTRGGTVATFDPQSSIATTPSDINASGTIAGFFQDAINVVFPGLHIVHSFLRIPTGAITAFDPPNSSIQTLACCINSAGTILGWYIDPGFGPGHGFLRAPNGTYTVFDPPGSLITEAVAINDE
jgi:hypothetical protein